MHLLVAFALIALAGALIGASGYALYLFIHRTQQEIAELKAALAGKRPGYHIRNGLEDVMLEEIVEEKNLTDFFLHLNEMHHLGEAILKSNQDSMTVLRALWAGKYDPTKPATKQEH